MTAPPPTSPQLSRLALGLMALVALSFAWLGVHGRLHTSPHVTASHSTPAPPTGDPVLGSTAAAPPVAPPPPPPSGASGAGHGRVHFSDPRAPFKTLASLQHWCFTLERCWFSCRTRLRAQRDNRAAVETIDLPAFDFVGETGLHCSSNARILKVRRQRTSQGYSSIAPLLLPLQPCKQGEDLVLDVGWSESRVPYLHDDQPGPQRLLSLSQDPTIDLAHTVYTFAIPDTSQGIRCDDLQPTRIHSLPGWKVFVYDLSGLGYTTIHLGFTMGAATQAPPSPDEIFRLEP